MERIPQEPVPPRRATAFFTTWRLACLAVILIAGLIYLPALPGLFLWDDPTLVSGAGIGGGKSLASCFTHPFLYSYYRPIVSATFYFENSRYAECPLIYHQTNILLHILTTGLLISCLLAAFRCRRTALIGGLLFAIQPAQVSTVAFIGGRTDSLLSFFIVGYLWALVKSARKTDGSRAGFFLVALLAYAGAVFTKEQALPALFLAPFAFRCMAPDDNPARRWFSFWTALPFLLVAVAFLVSAVYWGPVLPVPKTLRPGAQLAVFGSTVVYYALLLLTPTPRWIHTFSLGVFESGGLWVVAAGYLILALLCALGMRLRRTDPVAAWFLAATGLLLLPVSNLIPMPSLLAAPYRAGVAGLCVAALLGRALAAVRMPEHPRLWRPAWQHALGSLFVLWCIGLSVWGAGRWKNAVTLFSTIVRYDPYCILSNYNLAITYLVRGEREKAVSRLESTLSRLFRSDAWKTPERTLQAIQEDQRILARAQENPSSPVAPRIWLGELFAILGNARLGQGDLAGAKQAFQTGEAVSPDEADINIGLGICAYSVRDYKEAQRRLRKAAAADSRKINAHRILAAVFMDQKQWLAAKREYMQCVRIEPTIGMAYVRVADTQIRLGDRKGAVTTLRDAIRKAPVHNEASKMLEDIQAGRTHSDGQEDILSNVAASHRH